LIVIQYMNISLFKLYLACCVVCCLHHYYREISHNNCINHHNCMSVNMGPYRRLGVIMGCISVNMRPYGRLGVVMGCVSVNMGYVLVLVCSSSLKISTVFIISFTSSEIEFIYSCVNPRIQSPP